MGCFLACFGLSNKRKRRKTLYNVLGGHHQRYGNYQVLAITEKSSIVPYSDIIDKDGCKEKNSVKRKKKKVTFDLNVQIFELNPTGYQALDNEEEENENKTAEEPEGKSSSFSTLGEGSAGLTMTYPSNYRYYNCCYDEEDEIGCEESDIDDCDDDDEFDDEYGWDDACSDENLGNDEAEVNDQGNIRHKDLSKSCYSSVAEERIKNQMLLASDDTELKPNLSGRDRSISMHSVLVPVENLTQWKAIKAKVASSKLRRKENVPSEPNTSMPFKLSPCSLESNILQSKPLLQEIAVDASLSNWLVSPSYDVSKATIHCQ